MRLAYLYIHQFRNFTNEEFNFTLDFSIHYDKYSRLLSVHRNRPKLPEDFWGKNIQDLFMIVGNNGAGKTGLMQFIIKLFISMSEFKSHAAEECGFVLFEEAGKFYSYIMGNLEPNYDHASVTVLHQRSECKRLERTKLMYLTSVLSIEDSQRNRYPAYDRYSFFYDCSIGALFHADNHNDVYSDHNIANGISQLDTYLTYEQYKQIKFIFDGRQSKILKEMKAEGFRVPVPQKLYIDIIISDQLTVLLPAIEQQPWKTPLEKFTFGFEPLWKDECRNLPGREMRNFAAKYLPAILARCTIRALFSSIVRLIPENNRGKILEWTDQWEADEKNGIEFYKYTVEWICDIIEQYGKNVILNNESLSNALLLCNIRHYYQDFLDHIFTENIPEHFQVIEPKKWLTWDYSKLRCSIDTSDEWFIAFLQKYRYVCNPDYFLNFDWKLSSGEKNLISLFSSLYYIFDRDYTKEANGDYKIYNKRENRNEYIECDSLILMLDEADLTYHPEWQREFIRIFTGFVTKIYSPDCCKNIQLLLSTHSPILLSDMPGENIIYLGYNADEANSAVQKSLLGKTFGQNIYMLFKYNFF